MRSAAPHQPRRARCARGARRTIAVPIAVVVALGLVLVGCGSGDGTEAGAPTPQTAGPTTTSTAAPGCAPAATAPAAGTERVELSSGGEERWYDRLVPSGYDGTPVPLVIDLHGYLSGAETQAAISGFGAHAEREGFVLATPQGNSDLPYWNATPEPDLPDDVGFVADVIDDVSATVCIDPDRVYVDGFSNGAFLASLVACELSDRVAAIAAVAGLLVPEGCAPSRPVPVLAIHGSEDRYVPPDGGAGPALADLEWSDDSRAAFAGLAFGDVTEAAATWAELDRCDPTPTRSEVSAEVGLTAYGDCAGGAAVDLYVVDGGGHTWPSSAFSHASAAILGPTTDDIDATELIWSFFEEHPRP